MTSVTAAGTPRGSHNFMDADWYTIGYFDNRCTWHVGTWITTGHTGGHIRRI